MTQPRRPLTPTEHRILAPLLDRLALLRAQAQELELGISAAVALILGEAVPGAQLTVDGDRLIIVTPESPEATARRAQALIDAPTNTGD